MTQRTNVTEAAAVLKAVLAAVLATLQGQQGRAGADLTYAVGDLTARVETAVRAGVFADDAATCFRLAREAGCSLAAMAGVRAAVEAMTPISVPAKAVAALGIQLALIQEAQILAATTFTSRDDVDTALAVYGDAFDAAQDDAADDGATDVYRSLVSLGAALTADLTTRSRPLPRMVDYAYGRSYTALGLGQRLYGDPSRAEELVGENKVVHPAFMPRAGRALWT